MRTRSQARKRRQQQVQQTSVEPPNLEKPNNNPPISTMADNRTMAQLLEAPTEGYEDAIVIPEITANNFEIKHGLLNLVQNKQFFGNDKEDPHAHVQLHQLDTFYNALNSIDQDSLNSAAGGNFLDKMPRECLKIIESKSKVRQSRNKAVVAKRVQALPTQQSHSESDFVVVDFEPDPRVPLILGRCFLKTSHALIDVYEGEITLRVGKEAITFNLDQTSRYTADYNHMTVNKIDVIDMACDEYSQEVLGFSNVIASGNPTPYSEPIVSTASPTLTPFGDSDFLLMEEADSFLALEDDPTSSEVDPTYQDPEGDILLLEAILNSEPPPPLPNHEQYMPGARKELKLCKAKTVEPSINEPPEVELKVLPPHLEYAFLEGDNKLPVIIAKDLKDEERFLSPTSEPSLGNSPI
ncbi:hypothetical protein Tco_0359241 [Tanacetum coccineum]